MIVTEDVGDAAERIAWATAICERMSIPEPNSGCHLWVGSQSGKGGYSVAKYQGKATLVTRALLGLGPACVPFRNSPLACHSCDTPACVNRSHLFIGSHSENVLDAERKGRRRGKQNSRQGRTECQRAPSTHAGQHLGRKQRQAPMCYMSSRLLAG